MSLALLIVKKIITPVLLPHPFSLILLSAYFARIFDANLWLKIHLFTLSSTRFCGNLNSNAIRDESHRRPLRVFQGGAKPNQGEGAGGGCAPSRAKRESFQCYSVL